MITEQDIVAAIRAAQATPASAGDAMTTRELADVLGISTETAKKRIRLALAQGVLRGVKVLRPSIDGRVQPVAAWTLP